VTSVDDPRFENTFEKVFTAPSLAEMPFYVIAGNHDHGGNVSAQIEYSQRSKRWMYPEPWFTVTSDLGNNATLEVVMIDTFILSGNSDVRDEFGDVVREKDGWELTGPEEHMKAQAASQMEWLEDTLKASTASFLVVAGHYPVWSICEHGPTAGLVQTLKPLFEQYHVTAYIAGHDHCIESFVDTGIDYHGMGASHINTASTAHANAVPKGLLKFHTAGKSGGFGSFFVNETAFIGKQHEGDGTLLYTAPTRSPRSLTPAPPPPPAPPAPGPVPPPPPAPTPAGKSWECHAKTQINDAKVSWLTDADIKDAAGNEITGCEEACNGHVGCVAIVWHGKDNHCHTLSGPAPTHDQLVASLDKEASHTSCFLVDATSA